jgi:hypothetical protein
MTTIAAEPEVVFSTDSTGLAWLAETADGNRDAKLVLVLDKDQKPQLRVTQEEGDRVVTRVEVATATKLPDRVQVEMVICKAPGFESQLLRQDGFDALFWTESAVEKFLYPYYRSQRLWDNRMDRLMEKFNTHKEAMAIAHQAPSRSSTLDALVGGTLHVGCLSRGEQSRANAMRWLPLVDYLPDE